jgi:sugar phosphate isomerase/epimerase
VSDARVVREDRREFLKALAIAAVGTGVGARSLLAAKGQYAIAYTSFAIRLQHGRDLVRGQGKPSLPAEAFIDLCRSFGADGCQLDISQIASTEPAALESLKKRLADAGLFLELSVGAKSLEDERRFAEVVAVARRLGALRLRVALLSGRRYESFPTMASWREFADHWGQALPRLKGALDRHRMPVGLENHKDWRADELVALLKSVDSPYLGACIDFGNNLSLLEDPLETVSKLAPFAVTTHLKDMAVRPYEHGFELAEVPLGSGLCPLAKMVEVLHAARPDAPLCLEMITRDPLKVPCFDEAYWATYEKRDEARIEAFRAGVLSKATIEALPRISGKSYEGMLAAEDENVRRSTEFARKNLHV